MTTTSSGDPAPVTHFETDHVRLVHGNAIDALRELPSSSVHAVVTDPPYGLANTKPSDVVDTLTRWASGDREFIPDGRGFMGRRWDRFVPPPAVWDECLRVLKPGGHLLAFAGSRTYDLMGMSIRFAGFDIRDGIAWLYGSGFPKSTNMTEAMAHYVEHGPTVVQKVIPPELYTLTAYVRAARDAAGWTNRQLDELFGTNGMAGHWTTSGQQPAAPSAQQWATLKERLGMGDDVDELAARFAATERPEDWGQAERTDFLTTLGDAEPEEQHGWGTALKPAFEPIVFARKPFPLSTTTVAANVMEYGTGALNIEGTRIGTETRTKTVRETGFGANFMDDGWQPTGREYQQTTEGRWPTNVALDESQAAELDRRSGRPSRFYFVSKAPSSEKPEVAGTMHATVKPLDLMRQLVRTVTPPGGTVLEPFAGSGTTLEAAVLEGFDVIGIEREADYLPLIMQRLDRPHLPSLFGDFE